MNYNDPRFKQMWLLAQGWRLSWRDFDGRTLRAQVEGILKGDDTGGEEFYCAQCRDCEMDDVACLAEMQALWTKFVRG